MYIITNSEATININYQKANLRELLRLREETGWFNVSVSDQMRGNLNLNVLTWKQIIFSWKKQIRHKESYFARQPQK